MLSASVRMLSAGHVHCSKPRSLMRTFNGRIDRLGSRLGRSRRVAAAYSAEDFWNTHASSSYNSSLWSYDIEDNTFLADIAAMGTGHKHVDGLGGICSPRATANHHEAVSSSHGHHSFTMADEGNHSSSDGSNTANSSSCASIDSVE